jgi:chromate transporter
MTPKHSPKPPGSADQVAPASVSFAQAFRFWLQLGFVSFGGPAGQIAIMHAELVERRRWISEKRFLHALNFCMLLPGPEAQQLTIYIGWLMFRTWGGIVAGVLFVLPSLFILVGLSWVYLRFGDVPLVAGCSAWLVCRLLDEPHNQQAYDLFIGEVIAAWADERV